MPADFDKCERDGGRIRTVTGPNKQMGLKEGEYVHICVDKQGKVHRGYVKTSRADSLRHPG